MTSNNQYLEYLRYNTVKRLSSKKNVVPENLHKLAIDVPSAVNKLYVYKYIPQFSNRKWFWNFKEAFGPYKNKQEIETEYGYIPDEANFWDVIWKEINPMWLYQAGLQENPPESDHEIDWRPNESIPEDYHT